MVGLVFVRAVVSVWLSRRTLHLARLRFGRIRIQPLLRQLHERMRADLGHAVVGLSSEVESSRAGVDLRANLARLRHPVAALLARIGLVLIVSFCVARLESL